jgi:ATP-independent RNA helicase DbpA
LFSATFPDAVRALSASYQRAAVHVTAPAAVAAAPVVHAIYDVEGAARPAALVRVLGHHQPASAVIFCNQRETCDEVAAALTRAGFPAVALHGGMDQHDRNTVLLLLRNGSLRLRGRDRRRGARPRHRRPRRGRQLRPAARARRASCTGSAAPARAGKAGLAISLVERRDGAALDELRAGPSAEVAIARVPAATDARPAPPAMATIAIQGGRQDKLRPGDIVGALTTEVGLAAADIGAISVTDRVSFVAIAAAHAARALAGINAGRIKNRRFRAYAVAVPRGGAA